jgi:hypothetical protein
MVPKTNLEKDRVVQARAGARSAPDPCHPGTAQVKELVRPNTLSQFTIEIIKLFAQALNSLSV